MTLSLIFIGLLGSLMHKIKIPIESALWGLLLGYTLPWLVNKFYFIWRKHDGFGGGDFKLLAALGVWLGWQNILPILTIASVLALLVALTLMLKGKKIHLKTKLPFGPFLIMASVIMFYYPIDKFIL